MATEDIGSLVVRIETNLKNFNKGMDNVSDRVDRIGGGVKKLGGIIAGAFAVGAIVNFGKKGIQLASDLREVQNVVDTTFGSAADKINEFANTAIEKFGLSELQAKQFAGSMGAMLKSSGLAGDKVVEMSTSLTGLAGDFASFYNLPHDEAWQKLRSGISGETEPLRQLGINMSVANLEAFALSQGVNKAWTEMTQAEQVTLRYNYLMTQSKDAQGDFNKTQDSFANLLRTVSQQLDGVIASLADKLLPKLEAFLVWIKAKMPEIKETATDAFNNISAAINFFRDNANILIPVIAGLASAILAQNIIGGITKLYKAWQLATTAQTTAQWLLNIAMTANPIGLVAAAIGILVAAGIALYRNWDVVKEKTTLLWETIKNNPLLALAAGPIGALIAAGVALYKNWDVVSTKAKETWGAIKGFVGGVIDGLSGSFKGFVNEVISGLNSLIRGLNRLNVKIPDWVPGLGGGELGFNIPEIPKLAKGTNFVPFDTTAFLHKGEAVVPAKNNPSNPDANNPVGQSIDYDKLGSVILNALSRSMPTIAMDGQRVAKVMWPRLVAEKDRLGVSTL